MKKRIAILMAAVAVVATGCVRVEETLSCNDSQEIIAERMSYVETEVYDETLDAGGTYTLMGEDFSPEGTETIEGKEYYYQSKTETLTEKEFEEEYYYAIITNESFYGDITNSVFNTAEYTTDEIDEVSSSIMKEYLDGYKLTVKFDHEVTKTNEEADGKNVTFEYNPNQETDYSAWYAYTDKATHTLASDRKIVNKKRKTSTNTNNSMDIYTATKDTTKPTIKLLKARNRSSVKILVKDNQKLKKVSINGKDYTALKKRKTTTGKYKGYYVFSSKRKGKNKVVAWDVAGNVRRKSFIIG